MAEKLCGLGRLVKVKRFPGSAVDDLSYHVIPIIQKKPTIMIIHIRTNDTPSSRSRDIQDNLFKLKSLVNEKLLQCKVWLSTSTLTTDHGKAALTVSQLGNHPLNLNIDVIDNRNIKNRHLRRIGLHLNDSGSKLLARNFLEKLKLFWVDQNMPSIIKDNDPGYLLKDYLFNNPSGHNKKHIVNDNRFDKFWMMSERKISVGLL